MVLAFLDGGADCHLVTRQLFDELGLKGQEVKSKIGLANGSISIEDTHMTDLLVRGLDGSESYKLTSVIVKEVLADVSSSAPTAGDFERNPHLSDVEIPVIERDQIDLIIGLNARNLHEIHDKKEAGPDQLCAGKCLLGWFLYGNDCTASLEKEKRHVCFVSCQGRCSPAKPEVGGESRRTKPCATVPKNDMCLVCLGSGNCQSCEGTGNGRCEADPEYRAPSIDDDRAKMILDTTCTFVDGHYEIGLLWATEKTQLPDNYIMAKGWLDSLGKRLKANPKVKEKYRDKVNAMLKEGHAVEVHDRSLGAVPGRTFYIPHHNIASSKFRIVMDCAATYKGVSLNSVLLQGPDNFNSLLGVLLRFRFYPVAVVADIKNIFFQVKCRPQDQSALRFLFWENGDPDGEVKVYQSTVHCFGLTCSPCVASYALAKTAADHQSDFSDAAVDNVTTRFYVDDWLTSVKTVQQARALIAEVDELLARGGFTLMKFCSNEPEVLKGIIPDRLAPDLIDVDFHRGDSTVPNQKSLGMIWNPGNDLLRVKISRDSYPWTRRGFLSFESRIFDPLGIIDPFKLPAKLIMRDLASGGYAWDDPNLPTEIKKRWERWVKYLNCMEEISLPRCHLGLHKAKFVELHCYADASKVGYGIVYYLRIHDGEKYELSFVLGKARVLPAICTTTPRAELHAALELVEFSRTIVREHKLQFQRIIFWTDSQTVLGYLKNSSKRLPIFEANRVKKILNSSIPSQWKWVDTSQNPADRFNRGVSPARASVAASWLSGPTYLLKEEEKWPAPDRPDKRHNFTNDNLLIEDTAHAIVASEAFDERGNNVLLQCDKNDPPIMSQLLLYFSTLTRLLKAIAWWRRMLLLWRQKRDIAEVVVPVGAISVTEYAQSLLIAIRLTQIQAFPDVLEALSRGDCHEIDAGKYGVKAKRALTPVRKYCPFLHDEVMRIGGRLQKSEFSFDVKHPIVLPRRHHVTGLIVMDAHLKCGHFASNFVLNELLSKYHIVGGKATVKHYIKRLCIECRNRNAHLTTQQMAPLPTGRVTVRRFPFEHCGVDYLCGLKVKQGRNELKRYGCVFTCLATRATHLEVANDLSTESFLMAFRRFLALTGCVTKVLYCDNGSNFRGAAIELKRGLERLNKQHISGELALQGVKFRFNPPLASHQGGVFESVIKLVRKTMTTIMDDKKLRTLTDEGLQTLFREIQLVLNRRPLTRISTDPDDF